MIRPLIEESSENKERLKRIMITTNFDLRGIESKLQSKKEGEHGKL